MSLKERRNKWRDRARRVSNWIDNVHDEKKRLFRYLKYLTFPIVLIFVAVMALIYTWVWFIERVSDFLEWMIS
jgi:hypothetical protein